LCAPCFLQLGLPDLPDAETPPDFGDYELLEELGRGAMGAVWKVRQKSLNRVLALKLMLSGQFAGEAERRRFRTEVEAAASLDHPHLVPIYEVSEQDGRPYFTMKFMDGGSLGRAIASWKLKTENCKSAKPPEGALSVACSSNLPFSILNSQFAIASLIAALARAVHHAHQRGIIHRDLKPSNILLDAQGQPHVADFGLAKRLERGCPQPQHVGNEHAQKSSDMIGKTGTAAAEASRAPGPPDSQLSTQPPLNSQTLTGATLGTPAYMAPEQAAGKSRDVTTAADVYSLGAILYELLAGWPPFTGASPLEILRKVVDEEPVPPSIVRSSRRKEAHSSRSAIGNQQLAVDQSLLTSAATEKLDRDLETICLKCLEKNPADRYPSADALADDLERWQRHEPILARPASPWDRARKWVRRNPVVAALSGLLLAAVIAGFTAVLWQLRQTERARQEAERNLDRAIDAVTTYQMRVADDERLKSAGLKVLRRDLLAAASDFFGQLARDHQSRPQLQAQFGKATFALAETQSELGLFNEAVTNARNARAVFNELGASASPLAENVRYHTDACHLLAKVLRFLGQPGEAESFQREALIVAERLVAEFPTEPAHHSKLTRRRRDLATFLYDSGRPTEAEPIYRAALERLRAEVQTAPGALEPIRALLEAVNLGEDFRAPYHPDLGEQTNALAQVVALAQALFQPQVERRNEDLFNLSSVLSHLGELEQRAGQSARAEKSLRDSMGGWNSLTTPVVQMPKHLWGQAEALGRLGEVLVATGRRAEGEETFTEALRRFVTSLAYVNIFTNGAPAPLAALYRRMARHQKNLGNLPQAIDLQRKAQDALKHAVDVRPGRPTYRHPLADLCVELGELLVVANDRPAALAAFTDAQAHYQHLADTIPGEPFWRKKLEETRARMERLKTPPPR
jgi:serine/threonine protein kinase